MYTIQGMSLSKCPFDDIHCGCHKNPCQHGTCLSHHREGDYHVSCNCHHGFTGHLCDQEMNHSCQCLNGGMCHNDHSGCLCTDGYYGDFCQIISDRI
jgi:hypothetical protein